MIDFLKRLQNAWNYIFNPKPKIKRISLAAKNREIEFLAGRNSLRKEFARVIRIAFETAISPYGSGSIRRMEHDLGCNKVGFSKKSYFDFFPPILCPISESPEDDCLEPTETSPRRGTVKAPETPMLFAAQTIRC